MKLQYTITIHRYPDDKKRKNEIRMDVLHTQVNGKPVVSTYDYCCDAMANAFDYDHITISYDKRNFHVKRDKQSEILKEPVVCLKTFDEIYDYDSGLDEYNLPIKFCPFCAEEIIFELTEKKKITHACKKITRSYESCEDETKEEIIFSKLEKILGEKK